MLRETLLKEIPELKIHGRTTACRDPLTLFWTASGFECNVTGSELWVELEVTFDMYEPWFSYTVNGDWVGRQMLQKGRTWIPLFRGMSPERVKNVRFFKDLQAMSGDGESYIHIHALRHDGVFCPVAEKKLKIEFIGDSITSGEGLLARRRSGTGFRCSSRQSKAMPIRRHKNLTQTTGYFLRADGGYTTHGTTTCMA